MEFWLLLVECDLLVLKEPAGFLLLNCGVMFILLVLMPEISKFLVLGDQRFARSNVMVIIRLL